MSIEDFLAKTNDSVKLIYGSNQTEVAITPLLRDRRLVVNCIDTSELGALDKTTVYLVTRDDLMRSFDYRSDCTEGVELLFAKMPFNHRHIA